MTILLNGFLDLKTPGPRPRLFLEEVPGDGDKPAFVARVQAPPTPEALRQLAWEIGERRPIDSYTPTHAHVGLAAVRPTEGFAHWRIPHDWVEATAKQRGAAWHNCRPVLRLYDISCIQFNGFNAHRVQDHTLPSLCGELFFGLPNAGTSQVAEVGFLLRNGEFIPAARSQTAAFPPAGPSSRGGRAALLVDGQGRIEEIANLWEQDRVLDERRRPRLRRPLRLTALALASLPSGQNGSAARFVSELAAGQAAQGHEVHVLVPASEALPADREEAGVHYHTIEVTADGSPLERARAFGAAAALRLRDLPPPDLVHLHDWMAALGPRGEEPAILSLSSVEGAAPQRDAAE